MIVTPPEFARILSEMFLAFALWGALQGAVSHRFAATSVGAYQGHSAGTLLIDGPRWSITYAPDSDERVFMTRVIGRDGELIAVNDANQTWYRLKDRALLAAHSSIEVTRRLDGGAAFRETLIRTIDGESPAKSAPADFAVPPTYRFQEPVVGGVARGVNP